MDILEQLEERVTALLASQTSLAAENVRLREELAISSSLQEENMTLRAELEVERAKNQEALARVTSILQRMKDRPE